MTPNHHALDHLHGLTADSLPGREFYAPAPAAYYTAVRWADRRYRAPWWRRVWRWLVRWIA
jgi:hypothetical protein